MSKQLPQRVDPQRLARAGTLLEGSLPLARFSRLAEAVRDTDGEVHLHLAFHRNPGEPVRVAGDFSFVARLVCQACLAPADVSLAGEINLLLPGAGEKGSSYAGRADRDDVFLMEGPTAALVDLLEDDLILSLPMAPRCRKPECAAGVQYSSPEVQSEVRPFAALKSLLGSGNQ